MKQQNHFIPGITIFLVMLITGGWVTYQLLIDEPASRTTNMPTVQRTSQDTLPHPRAVPAKPVTVTTTVPSTTTASDTARAQQTEKPAVGSGSSLAHASTVPVPAPTATTISATPSEEQTEKEKVLTLADLQFGLNGSRLGAQAKKTLDTYAKTLADPQWSVLIQGHTDESGSIRHNLGVGLHRASAVKEYLMAQGIPGHRLNVVSLGEYQPVCTDMTPACQLQNRRVSFSLAHREHVETPPVVPVTLKKAPPAGPAVLAIEHVSLPDMNPEPLSKADLTEMQANLNNEDDAETHVDTNTTQAKMEPIYPEPVHSTPPPAMTSNGHNN